MTVCVQCKAETSRERVQPHLREQLVHSLLDQGIKGIHGVAGSADEAVLAVPTLQIHNPVLDISRVDAQQDAKGDGRHGT